MPDKLSFLQQHMYDSLQSDPSWTPEMYCVYNDLSKELTKELVSWYKQLISKKDDGKKHPHS